MPRSSGVSVPRQTLEFSGNRAKTRRIPIAGRQVQPALFGHRAGARHSVTEPGFAMAPNVRPAKSRNDDPFRNHNGTFVSALRFPNVEHPIVVPILHQKTTITLDPVTSIR